jgi:uncharacterized short protein YbdD (DUF466 family)
MTSPAYGTREWHHQQQMTSGDFTDERKKELLNWWNSVREVSEAEKEEDESAKRTRTLDEGMQRGKEWAEELIGSPEAVKAAYANYGNTLKDLSTKGLDSSQAAAISKQFDANSLAARAAMGSQGIRGGSAAMVTGQLSREMAAEKARASQELMAANLASYGGHLGQQMNLMAGMPFAGASLQYGINYNPTTQVPE